MMLDWAHAMRLGKAATSPGRPAGVRTKGAFMDNYPIIDADGHVLEAISGVREFLDPRWQR